MGIKRLDHIGIAVENLEEAKDFIKQLGLTYTADHNNADYLDASFFKVGDIAIALLCQRDEEVRARRLKGEPKARIDHLCFEVDDLDETVAELEAQGVRFNGGEFESPEGLSVSETTYGSTRSVFTDPDSSTGFMFQFVETTAHSVAEDLAVVNGPVS